MTFHPNAQQLDQPVAPPRSRQRAITKPRPAITRLLHLTQTDPPSDQNQKRRSRQRNRETVSRVFRVARCAPSHPESTPTTTRRSLQRRESFPLARRTGTTTQTPP